jgi:hypothetical protein
LTILPLIVARSARVQVPESLDDRQQPVHDDKCNFTFAHIGSVPQSNELIKGLVFS